jgi:hypothetical protein
LRIVAFVGFMKWRAGDDGPPQKDLSMNAAARQEEVESLIARLNPFYVFTEKAAAIERGLRAQPLQGEFDDTHSARKYARALTENVQALVPDRHLEVRYFEAPIPVRRRSCGKRQTSRDLGLGRDRRSRGKATPASPSARSAGRS